MNKVILISGKSQSGKNTFAHFLGDALMQMGHSVGYDYIAKDMKDNAKQDFARATKYINDKLDEIQSILERHDLYSVGHLLEPLRISDENWYENKTELSRILLQTYGTEIFQKRVATNYWDHRLRLRLEQATNEYTMITDVRWPSNINELSSSQEYLTYAIRINRDSIKRMNEHESETALDHYKHWSWVIDNNETIDSLKCIANNIATTLSCSECFHRHGVTVQGDNMDIV